MGEESVGQKSIDNIHTRVQETRIPILEISTAQSR